MSHYSKLYMAMFEALTGALDGIKPYNEHEMAVLCSLVAERYARRAFAEKNPTKFMEAQNQKVIESPEAEILEKAALTFRSNEMGMTRKGRTRDQIAESGCGGFIGHGMTCGSEILCAGCCSFLGIAEQY